MSDERPMFKAVYDETPPGLFEDDLRWQGRWYSGTTYHADGYERCGFYATKDEALAGARRAKDTSEMFKALFDNRDVTR